MTIADGIFFSDWRSSFIIFFVSCTERFFVFVVFGSKRIIRLEVETRPEIQLCREIGISLPKEQVSGVNGGGVLSRVDNVEALERRGRH
jgi:5-formaminoimidazole-4-carboxamide-1-beta-D-ribofuranosyl 5'-monophosphate synthetase